ncbi:MAG: hypothetical protein ACJ77K_10725 [Bacteroidia bacterium]
MQRPGLVFIHLVMLAGLFSFSARAERIFVVTDTIRAGDTLILKSGTDCELPPLQAAAHDGAGRKKIVSAICAFPFPFGFMGAHRVMLGTKPWVPVVYVATFGGCFGLLPLIDFCVLTFSKDISKYENNPHIFMWVTDSKSPETGTD